MIETINIDWSKLESCSGNSDARTIPASIDLLFSANEADVENGYWGIDNHAVVQSDLYSSAPYAARLIVDRYLIEKRVFRQLVDILFELGNGSNPEQLSEGPLAGRPIDALCLEIVKESVPQLSEQLVSLDRDLASAVKELLECLDREKR